MSVKERAQEHAHVKLVSVAGVSFRKAALEAVQGEPAAALIPEPDNDYDRSAVRVELDGVHVGYIPRGMTVSGTAAHVVKCVTDPPHVLIAVEC